MSDDFTESVARDIANNFTKIKNCIDYMVSKNLDKIINGNLTPLEITGVVCLTKDILSLIKTNMANLKFIEQQVIKNTQKSIDSACKNDEIIKTTYICSNCNKEIIRGPALLSISLLENKARPICQNCSGC